MGSINCKEYKTTVEQNSCNSSGAAGTTGTYQSTRETSSTSKDMSEYTDPVVVCNEDDIKENEMKPMELDENTKILLIKQDGKITAIGNKCTHYGAPLHTGVLGKGHVRCPWHGACFNITTGDIEDFPGLDSLPCYQVNVTTTGQVQVSAKRSELGQNKRVKKMHACLEEDKRIFVIVGGGVAGAVCAETLRQEGHTGPILVLCKENYLPYDRVKLSKSLDVNVETIQLRNEAFYKDHNIEFVLGVEAVKLDKDKRTIFGSNGTPYEYEKLFLATGCTPRKAPIPGNDAGNIFTLREYEDAVAINKACNNEMNAVCLGASFIALETAAYLSKKAKTVTIVGRDDVPLKKVLGSDVGMRIQKLYEENGVKVIMNSGIRRIHSNSSGKVTEVVLRDHTVLPCDLLIMGTGSIFNTKFLSNSGLEMNKDGSINVDMCLRTSDENIYAGGDIANAAVYPNENKPATIGHYQLAQYHGRIAAINMVGKQNKELHAVPVFFTMIFGKGIRYSGFGSYKDCFIDGDLDQFKFIAYYFNEDNFVNAIASCGRDPVVAAFAELQLQGKPLHREEVEGVPDSTSWMSKVLDIPTSECKINAKC